MKTLIAAGLVALLGLGSVAAIDVSTAPASAAAVIVKVGPGHHHWRHRYYWHNRYWYHRQWACRWHRRHRVCVWRYW